MQTRRRYIQADITQPIRIAPEQPTVPMRRQQAAPPLQTARPQAAQPAHGVPRPLPPAKTAPGQLPARRTKRGKLPIGWILASVGVMVIMSCAATALGVGMVYAGGILPGVHAGGAALGGLSEAEAAQKLRTEWATITVRDGQRAWDIDPATLGITLDPDATARSAFETGRGNLLEMLPGIIGRIDVEPAMTINLSVAEAGLRELTAQFEQPATNAGVRLVNGQIQTTPPINGRALDVGATVAALQYNPGETLKDGTLELVMRDVLPSVTDATPMIEEATRLLSSPLSIRVYDPATGDSVYWDVFPEEWGNWLTATPDSSRPSGLALTASDAPVRAYLTNQIGVFDPTRYLKMDEAVSEVQAAIERGETTPTVRVYHRDRQHVVQAGETIISIAWDYGIPYLYIQQANGGLENVSVGQTITIPSTDTFLLYPPDPNKRIEVSISEQRTRVYENGALKWDWPASTGISDSPTWPGIYQIISHVPNAYAGNWNLWMPNFLGVYQPIPGSDFTNGFHGFPTRGNSQLLWTNSLGTRVTYGCILLSNENAQALYEWAQEGVVVEITA